MSEHHYRRGTVTLKHALQIVVVAASAFGLFFGPYSVVMAQETVKIFSLQKPDRDLNKELPEINDSLVYGLSWRFTWKTIEPQEGRYDWKPIDRAIELTGNAGKKVMLRVVPGRNTPDWAYQAGVKAFDFRNTDLAHPETSPESMRMAVPWDEVYLAKWENFIRAFGRRYNGDPHIYSIQMAGGGHIGEMNLPKAHEKWRKIGYSDAKLIAAWKRIIDAYRKAFPDVPTNLDINEPLGRRSDVLEPVVSYVLATYPGKVYLQQNGLRADFPPEDRIRRTLRGASGKTRVGYQMVGGKGFLDAKVGDRKEAFRNAIEDHASYIEVYASDVRDPAQRKALEFVSGGGAKPGAMR